MKYIKTYVVERYKIDDYILLYIEKIKKEFFNPKRFTQDFAKIIDIRFSTSPYEIEFLNETKIYINDDLIIRKLTPEEVEIRLEASKYNL